jgi:crotonobetainyl-CoA:carnitine CoA-transferase CaiB-like acyl-CoA transferase
MGEELETLLGPYRALDLTNDKGFLCGRILADLGADVIKIEKPGGDPARKLGPFYRDILDSEKSLYWFAYNLNKRGITLDIDTVDGRDLFKRLVKTTDWVIESFDPGYMQGIGLGYEALSQINRRIIVTSITPFGQSGPYRDYKGSDLVVSALSGYLYLTGNRDRAPVRVGFPQVYLHAAAIAAGGSMTALFYRETTGEGQHVDVAAQQVQSIEAVTATCTWDLLRINEERQGSDLHRPGTNFVMPAHYECQDGYVYFTLWGGATGARGNQELVRWMDNEGLATDFLRSIDWQHLDLAKREVDQEYVNGIIEPVTKFFKLHTKRELLEGAVKRHIMLFPLGSAKDTLESSQLAAREYWVEVEHPELGDTITYPGPFIKLSETPVAIKRRAPLIGEHNEEIYMNELGLTRKELLTLKQAGVI